MRGTRCVRVLHRNPDSNFSQNLPQVPDVVGRGKEQYRKRKKAAVDRCRLFLDQDPNKHWRDLFIKSAKKDDLADTVMQALSYIERWVPQVADAPSAVTAPVKPKKIVARKPNENQKATRYSQSNLVYLLHNTDEKELQRDKRFMKDLRRYYVSFEEFKERVV